MTDTRTCYIYKSPKRDLMYLYLPQKDRFDDLPDAMRTHFGEPIYVMELELHPQRPLAQAKAPRVLEALAEQGFYLQMPPKDPWAA